MNQICNQCDAVESNKWNTWLIINCKKHIMKMCRQGSNNLPFLTNLPYQSKGTHFNIPTCSKYNSKNKWKTHPLYPLPPLFFILFIRDKYQIKKMKRRRVKTIMFFNDVHIRSQLSYKNFTFCQKTIFWK